MNELVERGGRTPLEGIVFVTGATGFLGREIVRQLLGPVQRDPTPQGVRSAASRAAIVLPPSASSSSRPRGAEVHVLARATSDRTALDGLDVHWHAGDLRDAASIDRAVSDSTRRARELDRAVCLVHCGACVSYRTGDRALARAVNVEGTRAMLESAKRQGVSRFVFVSSVVTVGHRLDGFAQDESAPFNNARLCVDYVDTKRAAEELVLEAAQELDVVVVNPGVIFGPVDRVSNTARFIREMARGRPPLAAPPGSISVVGVEDAARGTLAALERGRRGERYLLVESHYGTLELLNEIAHAVGVAPIRRRFPRAAWSLLAACAVIVDKLSALEHIPPQALRMLAVDLCFEAEKARTELGWSPKPFAAVLAETIDHLRARGLLTPGDEVPAAP